MALTLFYNDEQPTHCPVAHFRLPSLGDAVEENAVLKAQVVVMAGLHGLDATCSHHRALSRRVSGSERSYWSSPPHSTSPRFWILEMRRHCRFVSLLSLCPSAHNSLKSSGRHAGPRGSRGEVATGQNASHRSLAGGHCALACRWAPSSDETFRLKRRTVGLCTCGLGTIPTPAYTGSAVPRSGRANLVRSLPCLHDLPEDLPISGRH